MLIKHYFIQATIVTTRLFYLLPIVLFASAQPTFNPRIDFFLSGIIKTSCTLQAAFLIRFPRIDFARRGLEISCQDITLLLIKRDFALVQTLFARGLIMNIYSHIPENSKHLLREDNVSTKICNDLKLSRISPSYLLTYLNAYYFLTYCFFL